MATVALVSLVMNDGEWRPFFEASGLAVVLAGFLILGLRPGDVVINRRQGFLLTSLAWLILPVIGAMPLLLSELPIGLADAVFESVSGLTTTGSTVLTDLDDMAPTLLLWRSVLQWLGGIGIIAMGIAILPFLRVGGLQLFRTESSDRSDKVVPRANELAVLLITVYVALTVLCALAYLLAGMTVFEAVNHAMTTISTGGYSTSDFSIGVFESPAIEWVATIFMLSGGLPFVLYVQAMRGRPVVLLQDGQVRTFLALLVGTSLVLSIWLVIHNDIAWIDAIRMTAFSVTSIVTTTGYVSPDYTEWGSFAVIVFLFLTFVGGCAGSTAGGFKVYRFQIVGQMFRVSTARMMMPHGVLAPTYAGRPVDNDIINSVAMFMIVFFMSVLVFTMALGMLGLDFQTSFSGAVTAIANVGPGIGETIGPSWNFARLPEAAKWLLSLAMILGRLEIVTLLVLVTPYFWRQ